MAGLVRWQRESAANLGYVRAIAEFAAIGCGPGQPVAVPFAPFCVGGASWSALVPQKDMENSWQQAHNLHGAFRIDPWNGLAGPVLLLDDVVDSGWTCTVAAALLRQEGSGRRFPLRPGCQPLRDLLQRGDPSWS